MTRPRNELRVPTSPEVHLEDSVLLTQVRSGNQRALASLYDRHSTIVYSVALRICRNPALADEILQKIFMQIWVAPESFATTPRSLDGQLGILSRDLAIDLMRRHKSGWAGTRSPASRLNPTNLTKVGSLFQVPQSPTAPMPDVDQRVLEMLFFDDKTPSEIAEEMGLPVDTIAGRLRKALQALRKEAADATSLLEDTGLEVFDLDTHKEFMARTLHTRNITLQTEGLSRLAHSFVQSPDTILQELVNAAVNLCGADSAGISLETPEKGDTNYYHWVATAGQYNGFLNAELPRYPSACGICLERGRPQLFRVQQRFFDIMGIEAPLVTDGILLPWRVEDTRGTIFIMAHGRTEAFDKGDGEMMRILADFAAMAVRHQRQQVAILEQAKASAAAAMASKLALYINNPLQTLINVAHLAAEGKSNHNAKTLGQELSADLLLLSALVNESLTGPIDIPN